MTTILLIDDQPYLQELFAEELMDEGYSVVSASDADSAKRSFQDAKPDLVLLDLYLDGFDGWDLLVDLKHKDPKLPVIILTAYDSYMDDSRASKADGYVVKSFVRFEDLKRKIADLLGG